MARIKGGQKLMWMNRRKVRPVPGAASGVNSMGLRPGEYYGSDDTLIDVMGESEDVFRAGYRDPRSIGMQAPPPQTPPPQTPQMAQGAWGRAKEVVETAKGSPEDRAKEQKIADLNAQIDAIIAKRQKEQAPEDEFRGPEKEYLEQPTKDGALPNAAPEPKQSNELVDVLKEMNKAIKAYKADSGPPQVQDKTGPSGMPDWAESGSGIVGRGATPPAAQTPPPPPMDQDQVGSSGMPNWATETPAPVAAPVAEKPQQPGQQYLLSEEEVRNIGSMTFDNLPTDRLILPPSYPTREDAVAEFDRLGEAGEPYPPVIFIRDEGAYVNIKDDPHMGRFTYGPEDTKLWNGKVLIQLQNAQREQRLKEVNLQIEQ